MELYNGYKLIREKLNDREVIVVVPDKPNGKWALKTEYFNAFPDVQRELLKLGYHIVHIQNKTRWCLAEDTDARKQLCDYMVKKYGLSNKCVIIGMSCGGMEGIYFASKYPECVSCMYLDAPVVNLLSCPYALGEATTNFIEEFEKSTGLTLKDLINYRNHPQDHIDNLIKYKIPIILVCGDSDMTVPYNENGKLIDDAYKNCNVDIVTIIKENADHHPHSLIDNTPIINFILEHDN